MKLKALGIIVLSLALSCASVGKFTYEAGKAIIDNTAIAQKYIDVMDKGLYATYMSLKENGLITGNDKILTTATRQLSGLDEAAGIFKKAIAGATVTDAELNKAAGQVDGAKSILKGMK